MTPSRLSDSFSSPSTTPDAGGFGLIAWLEQTRVRLPLKGVEARFGVTGDVAEVELDQVFLNDRDTPLDVTYTFPLPAAASVFRCEMIVQGRVVAALAEETNKARAIFHDAKREGRRAALVETVRENLFTLSLGNVPPREVIVIRLAYLQELERMVRTVALRIPVCPGVRYIPGVPLLRSNSGPGVSDDTDQVPDASRISPPRLAALHPDAAVFHVCGRLPSGESRADTLVSPTHAIAVRASERGLVVGFAADHEVPDRDFILRWEQPALAPGRALAYTTRDGDDFVALLRLAAPPAPASDAPVVPRDLWLLIDRSTSMAGAKWLQTCHALRNCVALLRPDDRVFLTFFSSGFQHFAEKPLPAAALLADPNFQGIERIGVSGGTELVPALADLLAKLAVHRAAARAAHLVILTDGQIGNEEAVHRCLAPHPHLQVHTIGIDTAVNDALLQRVARDHGGQCVLITPQESVVEAVETILAGLAPPVVTALRFPAGLGAPAGLPTGLFAGQQHTIVVRGPLASDSLSISGVLSSGAPWQCVVDRVPVTSAAPRLLWAQRMIATLRTAGRIADSIALAKQNNLLCDGVSFVAVDRTSHVAVAQDHFYQPAMEFDQVMYLAKASACLPSREWGALDESLPSQYAGMEAISDRPLTNPLGISEAEAEILLPGFLAAVTRALERIQISPDANNPVMAATRVWLRVTLELAQRRQFAALALTAAGLDLQPAVSNLRPIRAFFARLAGRTDIPEVIAWRHAARAEARAYQRLVHALLAAGHDPAPFGALRPA